MRDRRWSVREMMVSSMLMIHPRITFMVSHADSPFFMFLVEAGSWPWTELSLLRGRITVSSVCRRARLTRRWIRAPHCTKPRKSSTYISQWASGVRSWAAPLERSPRGSGLVGSTGLRAGTGALVADGAVRGTGASEWTSKGGAQRWCPLIADY
jgi:hypothetical protein